MKNNERVWVVVQVASGIPDAAEVFHAEDAARKRESRLRKQALSPENDEVGLFHAIVQPSLTAK